MPSIISRRSRFLACLLAVAAAFACGEPTSQPPPATPQATATPPSPSVRVVFLGDSLTAGLGLPEADAFPAVTADILRQRGLQIEAVNAGVSGDTSAGGLSRVDWVLSLRVDVLVVELGGNDGLRGQPLEHTEANLREIVRRGRAAGATVLLLGMDIPTNYGPEYGSTFAAMYERIAIDEGAILVPGFVREVGVDPSLLLPDGLHPNRDGHRRLAETLAPHLARALADVEIQ